VYRLDLPAVIPFQTGSEKVPARRIFLLIFMGVALPCIVLEIVGMALTTAYMGQQRGTLLAAAAKPLGSLGTFLLLLLALFLLA
jgi:purine-cytosine permease-like protein